MYRRHARRRFVVAGHEIIIPAPAARRGARMAARASGRRWGIVPVATPAGRYLVLLLAGLAI